MSKIVKLVTFVPKSHSNEVRRAIGDAGAGKIGNYSHNSFTLTGMGRWLSLEGANPTIGKVGELSEQEEERVECVCERDTAKEVIAAIRKVHPYEEVAIDIYPLISEEEL
jgi:hypothetical protein